MISKATIDEVLLRNDIESLISGYVSLKRAGSNFKGLCPFHNEKTPSFVVYPSDNSFFCFGCGVGGNAITFVRQIEHLTYPDAVEFLAKRAGITVIRDDENEYKQKRGISRERLLKMNVEAAKFFNKMLFAPNPKSKEALNYFTQDRGLALSTIEHFGLGFAPDGYDSLQKHLLKLGYTQEEMFEGFLASKSEKGRYYDSFRNRVMFPIIDVSGNVIAFGGRVMDGSLPKYRNSMDTVVFKKSRNLFALNFAKKSEADYLILCEGYMDVIALHAAGFTNAVATLGTAITLEQAKLMRNYTSKVMICYDADEAGQKATQRAMRILGEADITVGIIRLAGAKDPDEYIKNFGTDKFRSVISEARSKFDYILESILSKYDVNLPQDRIDALTELEKVISAVNSKAERDIYIQSVSLKLGVDSKSIKDDVERICKKNTYISRKKESERIKQQLVGYSDKVNPDYAKAPAVASHEETVLGLMLIYPEHQKEVFTKGLLSSDDFFTEFNKRVFEYIKQIYVADRPSDIPDINFTFEPEEVSRITKMKVLRMNLGDNGTTVLYECIDMLKDSMQKKKTSDVTSILDLDKQLSAIRSRNAKG